LAVGRIQELHHPEVYLTGLEQQLEPVVKAQPGVEGRDQPFVQEGINRLVLLPELGSVVGVGGDPL